MIDDRIPCWARRGCNARRGHRKVSGWSTHSPSRSGKRRAPSHPWSLKRTSLYWPATSCRCVLGAARRALPGPAFRRFAFLDRRAALVPPPRRHRHRYHGVLEPHAPLRAALTARAGLPMEGPVPERSLNAPLQAPAAAGTEKSRSLSAYQWAMLLARLYESQVLGMGLLGAPMRIIAFVTDVGLRGFHSAYPRLPRRARPGSAHLSSARIFWTHAATGTST